MELDEEVAFLINAHKAAIASNSLYSENHHSLKMRMITGGTEKQKEETKDIKEINKEFGVKIISLLKSNQISQKAAEIITNMYGLTVTEKHLIQRGKDELTSARTSRLGRTFSDGCSSGRSVSVSRGC